MTDKIFPVTAGHHPSNAAAPQSLVPKVDVLERTMAARNRIVCILTILTCGCGDCAVSLTVRCGDPNKLVSSRLH